MFKKQKKLNATVACYVDKSSECQAPYSKEKKLVPASGGCYLPDPVKNFCNRGYLARRRLPNNFFRILVFPDPEKDRLTKAVIPCPFRKFILADHHRFDPVTNASFRQQSIPGPTRNRLKLDRGI
jgi:hypothetical protein